MAATMSKAQLAIGGAALVSVAVLGWTLMRPTRETKKRKKGKKKGPKTEKFTYKVTKLPMDINLVMFNDDGFHAHVAGDKKNKKMGLKFGARLFKINDKKVENSTYEEILAQLQKIKTGSTLTFKEFPTLEADWDKAEEYREKSNELYKNGSIELGIGECSRAITLHPTNKVYYSNRILMYLKSNQLDAALEDCQKIRELDPLSLYVKGHYLRGLVLFNLKKIKHAAAAFQTVMKLEPEFKQAKVRLDECLKKLKIEEEQEEAKTNEKRRSSEKSMKAKLGDLADVALLASKAPENVDAVKEDGATNEGDNVVAAASAASAASGADADAPNDENKDAAENNNVDNNANENNADAPAAVPAEAQDNENAPVEDNANAQSSENTNENNGGKAEADQLPQPEADAAP